MNIDFENIHNKLLDAIEKGNNKITLKTYDSEPLNINDIAKINSALIITALKIYHDELINQLKQP